jgi:hypothetical protein
MDLFLSALKRSENRIQMFAVSGAAQDSSPANLRWAYSATRMIKNAAKWAGWVANPSDTGTYTIYSNIEVINGTTTSGARYGNGVHEDDITDAGGTFALQQIPNTVPVYCREERWTENDGTQKSEWWIINLANGVSGQCT